MQTQFLTREYFAPALEGFTKKALKELLTLLNTTPFPETEFGTAHRRVLISAVTHKLNS